MDAPSGLCQLDDLGLLRFHGADGVRFLQGQLSNDVGRLGAAPGLLAGLHNPQGRVLALLRLAQPQPEEILAVLPAELTATVAALLQRYVLRARVRISDDSAAVSIVGSCGAPLSGLAALPLGEEPRWLSVLPRGAPLPAGPALSRSAWRALDIAAGLPQVYAVTSGLFVAQMLNLDCIEAISFTKGCYTGQEVIARAHYRGRVKRRMQRFVTRASATLVPGEAGVLEDGRGFRVIEAVAQDDGRSEFLAVAALQAPESADEPGARTLGARQQPLPYPLPD